MENVIQKSISDFDIKKVIHNAILNFDGKVAVYFDDLKGNIIAINEHEEYNAASCIKIFILVELFNRIVAGKVSREQKLKYLDKYYVDGSGVLQYLSEGLELSTIDIATLMMIISDNVATNILIDLLGIDNINNTIRKIGCKNTELYSLFKISDNDVFSKTTAFDYHLVWKKLNNYELFEKDITNEILGIIKNNKYKEMIGDGINDEYKTFAHPMVNYIATKSGKYNSVRNDGGIVSTKFGNYIVVIFINNFKDINNMNDEYVYSHGRKISRILFNYFLI